MSLTNYIVEAKGTRRRRADKRRARSFAISAAVHATAFLLLMQTPEVKLPVQAPNEYEQAIEGHEEKVVWYQFHKDLPDVTPPSAKAKQSAVKALNQSKQTIVASPKTTAQREQFVWTPAPELKEVTQLDSANLIAVKLGQRAPQKAFVAPPDIVKPQTQIESAPDAPQLEAKALTADALPKPDKLVKQFVQPKAIRKEAAKVEIATDAPELEAKALKDSAIPRPDKLVKAFTAPPKKVPVKLPEVTVAPDAPQLMASNAAPDAPLDFRMKAPSRPFTAPPAKGSAGAKAQSVSPDAPPAIAANGAPAAPDALLANALDMNLAVVGLHPKENATALPTAASPAKFSGAPEIRRNGADSAGDGKGLAVPDLFVRGASGAKPDLIGQSMVAPTSAANLRAAQALAAAKANGGSANAARAAEAGASPLAARAAGSATQSAAKVSSAPEPRFNGRDVYMMAIQMPNLTSYSGSWLMWYSDRTAREAGLRPVAPPVAYRKVDPKYIASAQADKVEGTVRLACVIGRDGHVSTVELVRGLDARLNESAVEALGKWEFSPALRDGVPVEVDVLVEIPFRLAPGKSVSY